MIVKYGWIGRNDKGVAIGRDANCLSVFIEKTKGKKTDWLSSCWPPRKVKITVEEVKG